MAKNHYGAERDEPTGRVQVDQAFQYRDGIRLSEQILRLAHAEYEKQHPGQDYERMQQRGGLSVLEVVGLLADHVERLGGEPSKPRDV